jgi:hypothetical protein
MIFFSRPRQPPDNAPGQVPEDPPDEILELPPADIPESSPDGTPDRLAPEQPDPDPGMSRRDCILPVTFPARTGFSTPPARCPETLARRST